MDDQIRSLTTGRKPDKKFYELQAQNDSGTQLSNARALWLWYKHGETSETTNASQSQILSSLCAQNSGPLDGGFSEGPCWDGL